MAVFDKELDHLDPSDTAGSLRILENYISYMRERLEFNNSNLTRTLSSTGTSTAEIVLIVAAIQNDVSALKSSVAAMQGQLTSLEQKETTLSDEVKALRDSVNTANGNITALQSSVSSLEARVTALENKGGTT